MHYLAHFYVDQQETDPLFIAGLGLPDWINGFSKIYNQKLKNSSLSDSSDTFALHTGIRRHYEGDNLFHNHPIFVQLQSELLQSFVSVGLSRTEWRLSLLAHVGVELMIDRQIVNAEPKLLEVYYQKLNDVDPEVLKKYFKYHNVNVEQQDFLVKFHFFKTRKYLTLFNDINNIVIGLDKMYDQVLNKSFEKKEKEQIGLALHNMDDDIRYRWQELLNGIKL